MGSTDDLLTFMDLLDLDEELVDARLKTIMTRESFTKKHLVSAIQLLKYKYLINLQEDTECENDEECDFIARLVVKINSENVDNVCEIVSVALNLNKKSIVSKSEHLIQQILSNVDLPSNDDAANDERSSKTLLNLKLVDSILSALMKNGKKVSLLFLESSLEKVLLSSDEKLKIHFLTSTVPKLFQGSIGFNILDKIWDYLQQYKQEDQDRALKILSCLSEFYVPVADIKGNLKYQSEIVSQYPFWNLLLNGLMSNDGSIRKVAIYLMKRSIDNLMAQKRDVQIHDEISTLFLWEHRNEKLLKQTWDNFFILMDSLEEKQSNIVLPSLQLFETLKNIPACWLNCAFNMGLRHDNMQIRLKCIEYCLQAKVYRENEAKMLLEALNDINIYDSTNIYESLMKNLQKYFENVHTFVHIFNAIPKVKWSPIPLYHFSKVLADVNLKEFMLFQEEGKIVQNLTGILKIPCNNIAIRKAVQINISYFIGNCCKKLHWKHVIHIFTAFSTEVFHCLCDDNPFLSLVKRISLNNEEKTEFLKTYANIDLALLYLEHHPDSVDVLLNIIDEKVRKIHNVVIRQYSDKTECLKDVIFLMQFFKQTYKTHKVLKESVQNIIARQHKSIIQYLMNLLSCDVALSIEDMMLIFEGFKSISDSLNDVEARHVLLQMYKSSLLFLRDKYTDIDKKVFSLHIVEELTNNTVLNTQCKHEILTLEQALNIINKLEFKDNNNTEDNGRYRNLIYEKSCKLIFELMKEENAKEKNYKEVLNFIEKVTECGGYGCLKWILRIINEVIALVVDDDKIFNVPQFVNRMWRELEELKSNNQYSPCMEQFVNLIMQDSLLKKSMYNNLVILYCCKIIEYGPLKNSPLFFLVKKLDTLNITADHGQLIYVLCEMLLFAPVPKKDQRIMDNIAVEILNEPKYGLQKEKLDTYFNYQIQYIAVSILSKISNPEILVTITSFIITRVDEIFKNKPRYHGNSQVHRTLLISLQHLILMMLMRPMTVGTDKVLTWNMELLGRLPHQPSIRICLEWFIALNFYEKGSQLDEHIIAMMTSKNIPLLSQFMILYLTIKHKILNNDFKIEEFEFVMDFLLSHTMGQMFNIRLHAQYLATILANINHKYSQKYAYIIEVIEKTFVESSKDKNFVKLNADLFVNEFDIISNLTPSFIYYILPKYYDIGINESFDRNYVSQIMENIESIVAEYNCSDKIKKEWMLNHKTTDEILKINLNKISEISKNNENSDLSGTIQKKYIPWKNMSDIETYEVGKKRENPGELILVASLIDKLPNLGGMARTSEVFAVKTYVIDSIRHLQDKMFQGLSVSAERWVNIEEVRPGPPLKEYLMRKKTEGYCVVAAEQTSSSCPLQTFKFPKKSLLLLGHEKEGIPCDLLPIMDYCVEIPQQGFVRSLNVHVTAAIFVWEYTRQNIFVKL